jgi:methionyl-tRNA formyltransferase
MYANDINSSETVSWIQEKAPDVIFCFGWSRLLGRQVLELAPLGVIGFHPAAVPANKGRHPLIWALALGLKKTASTFFFMDESADGGDILSQCEITIEAEDDAKSLYLKVTELALNQIEEFVPLLKTGDYERLTQDKYLSNSWRKRSIKDGIIDWRMSAESIHNLVRALAKPYIGAGFVSEGKEIKVWKTSIVTEAPYNMEPGKVISVKNDQPVIKCGVDAICLLEVEPTFSPNLGSYL